MMSHINKNNAIHLSELFKEHTHTQCAVIGVNPGGGIYAYDCTLCMCMLLKKVQKDVLHCFCFFEISLQVTVYCK